VTASAAQVDLFATRAPMLRDRFVTTVARPLRPYQVEAVRRIREELATNRSTLLVLPTGAGKTRVFSEIAKDWDGPVLVVAHRNELIRQGRGSLEEICGDLVSTEKAGARAAGTRIVVGSVQTLVGERLASFARRHPATLVICDEAHHAVSPSYRAIFDAFPDAKLLGVTATPDRSDERAMGQVFDSVAFVYEIRQAIADGYLCPIRIKTVTCGEIDLSSIGTVAGDLNQGELDAVMQAEAVIHRIVAPVGRGDSLIELAGDRQTIVFCTSVDAAHRTAEVINRYRPDRARAVDGKTQTDLRTRTLKDHDAGRYQYLCNVGIATEGYDSPRVSCVAMARPTESRAFYAQCAGRGLRILDGKADCLLLDFVGNAGKHRLVSGLDILDGTWDDEVIAKARDILEAQGMDGMLAEDALEAAQKAIDDARQREAAKRLKLTAKHVQRSVVDVDPFGTFGIPDPEADRRYAGYRAEASEKQRHTLDRMGIKYQPDISKRQAHALLDARMGKATMRMVPLLRKAGLTNEQALAIDFNTAGAVIGAVKRNGFRRLSPQWLAQLTSREPGAEG
jgi:superfamily II DNA or RNA helicase